MSNIAKLEILYIRYGQYTEFHISNFWSCRSLERKARFFSPLGFDIQKHFDQWIPKINVLLGQSFKAISQQLKNLIHCRKTATILKYNAVIFETHFRLCRKGGDLHCLCLKNRKLIF